MKYVRESLSSFYDYKFFNRLLEGDNEEEEKSEEKEDTKPEKKDDDKSDKKDSKPEKIADNKNDKKEQGELRDKEKDGLAVIDKLKANFDEFKEDAKGEITKYKEFWEENKKTKEAFGEGGDVYKMFDSDYVVAVLELPAETLSDGSIDGGLGASDEPEEEIIEGPELGAMTGGNELTEDAAADQEFNLDDTGEEEDINLDLENPDGGGADQMSLDTDTQGAPAEVGAPPTDPMADPMAGGPEMGAGPMGGPEMGPDLTGPQVYFVVYDLGGDGEREEILRTGSNNVVNAFKEFYNDTFKGTMKGIILKYKEAKEQQKAEAEKTEKKAVEKEKGSKISKFLGESYKPKSTFKLNENSDDDLSDYEWEVGKEVSRLIPNYDSLDLGDEVGDALYDFINVIKKRMRQKVSAAQTARMLLSDPDFLDQLGLNQDLSSY